MIWRAWQRRRAAIRARAETDIDDELAFHRECTIRELTARGLSREAAESEAQRRFGAPVPYRQRLVDLDLQQQLAETRRAFMTVIAGSLGTLVRDLRRAPGFALGVMAILTLGLGVNAISFSLVNRLVLSGPMVDNAHELRRVVIHRRDANALATTITDVSYSDYGDLRLATTLAGVAAESQSPLLLGAGESASRVQARLVTGSYFPLLGATPAVGRFFSDEESGRLGHRVAVLAHAFWQRQFGGNPAVIGQILPIGANRYTVVGVAPPAFTGTSVNRTDVFLPLEAAADEIVAGPWRTNRGFRWMTLVVRLAPDASSPIAEAEATALHRRAQSNLKNADPESRIALAALNPIRGATATSDATIAALVGGVALLVFIIAIANVANLFLARAVRRRATLALQHTLGAARWRLTVEQAVEGAMLALIGAGVAIGVAWFGGPVLQRLLFPQVAWLDSPVDAPMLAMVGCCAVFGGAIAASLPLLQLSRQDLADWLSRGIQRSPRSRTRAQTAMLIVQGALSVLLLVGAGLFVRSLGAVQSLDLGLDTDRLLILGLVRGQTPAAPDLHDRLRASVEQIPGVERTTLVEGTIPFVSSWSVRLRVPGLAERPRVEDGGPYLHAVEPGYFDVVGTGVIQGRPFEDADREGAERVAIVNETMTRLFWPGHNPLGQCLQIGDADATCTRIVGVARNTRRQQVVEGDSLLFYVPFAQAPDALRQGGRLLIRTSADPVAQERIAGRVRRQAMQIDPSLRYVSARSLDDIVSPQLRHWRLGAGLFGVFGVLALAVTTIGLYSVLMFTVEGRRREMGIRAALGATASMLLGLMVRDGLKITAAAIGIGFLLAWWLAPLASDLLYGIPARDAGVFVTAAIVLIAVSILASAVPGLRAGRVDPIAALRAD